MKKIVLLMVFAAALFTTSAQVFNTAEILKPGTFAIGIQPTIIASGGSDFILFGHIGYGLSDGIDLSAKAGVLSGSNYYGADMEFALLKNMSLSAGAHVWGDFGLDATYLITFDIANNVDIYGGADVDFNFGNDFYTRFWIPFGVEVELGNSLAFLMEASIGLTDSAPHMFGGGVMAYF